MRWGPLRLGQWDRGPMSSNNTVGNQLVGGPMRRGPMRGETSEQILSRRPDAKKTNEEGRNHRTITVLQDCFVIG